MDLRKWLLLNEPPKAADLRRLAGHVPLSDYRTRNVLRLFNIGHRTGFRLTDLEGQPTEALIFMVGLMPGVKLCRQRDLLPEERKGFELDGPELVNTILDTWYLSNITWKIKSANSVQALSGHGWDRGWHELFLPGLRGTRIIYRDPDGKRRKRVCYIAECPSNWELTNNVYEGIWRWNDEHHEQMGVYGGFLPSRRPDAYGMLSEDPTLGVPGSVGVDRGPVQIAGPAAREEVRPALLAP